jgi:hypothetical protein
MKKSKKGSPGHSGGRGIVLVITEEIINAAIQRDSSHCVIADALRAAVPNAQRVSVDIQTIRFTDPMSERRYIYLTPALCQMILVDFDQGRKPAPMAIRLGNPSQITRSGSTVTKREANQRRAAEEKAAKVAAADGGKVRAPSKRRGVIAGGHGNPTILGGDPPPIAALSSTRGRRRTFGLRSLRP